MPEFAELEDLHRHLRTVHPAVAHPAALACDQWARGSSACPVCDLWEGR